ncbi:WD40-repeat-containing domain protein [Mrakia frigida]|uniref:WD40-repeat-containing domain protein n=1 Tax=Mrakia frigida TaxID=29902 RepID=UPI003FCC1D9D
MSISPANRDVVLASRKGLYIIDLTNPSRLPRFLPQGGLRSVADCQWNPSSTRPRSVVSTSAQKLLLWDLGLPSHRAISREVDAHTRAISDINWAVFNPDVVATAGIDGWIKCWDVRTSMDKDAGRFSAWGWGSTQVKWNRKEEHIVASSHDNKVLIWDRRMGSIPVTRIRAHSAKIYGIDWSREAGDEIVTCSLDKTIKLWNISSPSLPVSTTLLSSNTNLEPIPTISPLESALTKTLSVPLRTIHTASPVWRARFLPFGSGLLSLPQSQETGLDMWTVDRSFHQPSATNPEGGMGFEGHTDKVKEFVWRTRGGDDMERDDRTFQLITWGKDQSLRFWPIEEKTMLVSPSLFSRFRRKGISARQPGFVSFDASLLLFVQPH